MKHLLIRHTVADFARWKVAYDADLENRKRAGLKEKHLFRETSNPNHVFILFEAEDLQKAREFSASPRVREVMTAAGVMDKPDLYFLE